MHFELNDFVYQDKLIMFNLKTHLDLAKHDSLFIYTNINVPNTFVLCKDFRTFATNQYKCTDAKDLFKEYGRSIPPLLANRAKSTLKTLNIEDIRNLINDQEFTYLIVNIPILKKDVRQHQMIVKFDWYLRSNRVKDFELPSFKTNLQGVFIDESDDAVFRRYYLSTLKNVLQAYQLNKIETKCDKYLAEQSLNTRIEEKKPLSLSTVRFFFKIILQSILVITNLLLTNLLYNDLKKVPFFPHANQSIINLLRL